ncbi:Unknown protein [Striga hermonthica]|uniref:Uncharacterized protein n=1 Tax=Striga hermonthica TaxID=68872 RepID=A0A9N7MIF8_STRHE|nr:Unknown protein [Striga hermonthica]
MVCFCFLVDQKTVVVCRRPVAATCSRCRHGATVADMQTRTRFCYIPFYWKSWKAITCSFCKSILKSYRCCEEDVTLRCVNESSLISFLILEFLLLARSFC